MPSLLTYGDSNTYGTLPIEYDGHRARLGPQDRWPGVTRKQLGPEWDIIEHGLPGRTTQYPDAEMGPHMDGRIGLFIALESHGPLDILSIMLGTNDTKTAFGNSPADIAGGIDTLLSIALSDEMQDRHGGLDVLLICPPAVIETGELAPQFIGGHEKSLALPDLYGALADRHDVDFLNAGALIQSSPVDGVHFGADQHAILGKAVARAVQGMMILT